MFERLRGIFGQRERSTAGESTVLGLNADERAKIGTDEDPLHGYEVAMERHEAAMRADERGDTETAIQLYEKSVAEHFVGSHPYEALARLYERRRNPTGDLRVTESYIDLAHGGKLPRGAQRSAERKLPEFEARAERYRRAASAE